jgi:acyl-CoA reductase-like NAD-dependent aldehyde dehydrogenase
MDTIRRHSMVIGGDWVGADEQFEIRSPATEELVATVAKGGREHADRAIAAARAANSDGRWRQMPPAERAAVLDAIADGSVSGRLDRRAYPLLLSTAPD